LRDEDGVQEVTGRVLDPRDDLQVIGRRELHVDTPHGVTARRRRGEEYCNNN